MYVNSFSSHRAVSVAIMRGKVRKKQKGAIRYVLNTVFFLNCRGYRWCDFGVHDDGARIFLSIFTSDCHLFCQFSLVVMDFYCPLASSAAQAALHNLTPLAES